MKYIKLIFIIFSLSSFSLKSSDSLEEYNSSIYKTYLGLAVVFTPLIRICKLTKSQTIVRDIGLTSGGILLSHGCMLMLGYYFLLKQFNYNNLPEDSKLEMQQTKKLGLSKLSLGAALLGCSYKFLK